jgi:hypothetical protein
VDTKSKKAWYGVRTLYRLAAEGKPKLRDRHFDPESTLIEDRIVIFQAISFDDAIKQATKRSYARQTRFINMYGQKIRMQFLGVCDAFKIFDRKPAAGSEVYSSTELVRGSVSDLTLIRRRMGPKVSPGDNARNKFVDGRILRQVLRMVEAHKRADPR